MSTLSSQEVIDITRTTNYGTWRFQKGWNPMHIVDAKDCYIYDGAGKEYLDFSSQLMCSNLGHKNQAVIDSIAAQAQQLAYAMPGYATDARAELSKVLLEILPPALNKFFFTTSGTDANEAAFKIARMYTGKTKIIARYRSYHGSTSGSIAATGDPRRWAMEPRGKQQGVIFGPEVNCYRCPIKHTYPGCGIACADYLEHMIRNESDVAAVLVEPIVGTNGVIVPPEEYMPKLRRICDETGVLLIADEVMTGWGRTGKWFAMEHWGVVPDILTTAKGITSAYVPLGLCATSEAIGKYFDDHYFAHGHTYEAHPMTLAPAVATIAEMRRLGLVARSAELAPYVEGKLKALKAKHPSVGDVRGKGLFWAVELVKNRTTKEPFNTYIDKVSGKPLLVDQIAGKCLAEGVIIQAWVSHFVIAPPLIVTRDEIDRGIAMLDKHLAIADALVEGCTGAGDGTGDHKRYQRQLGRSGPTQDERLKVADKTIDGITSSVIPYFVAEGGCMVLLGQRGAKSRAFANAWCLVGGFLEPGKESLPECAARELEEETGLSVGPEEMRLVTIQSNPRRDPRGVIVDTIWSCRLAEQAQVKAADDVQAVRWCPLTEALAMDLAFDHRDSLRQFAVMEKLIG